MHYTGWDEYEKDKFMNDLKWTTIWAEVLFLIVGINLIVWWLI